MTLRAASRERIESGQTPCPHAAVHSMPDAAITGSTSSTAGTRIMEAVLVLRGAMFRKDQKTADRVAELRTPERPDHAVEIEVQNHHDVPGDLIRAGHPQ